MKIRKEQEEQIINFGAFGYDAEKIANILNADVNDVIKDMADASSNLSRLLKKGCDMADYVIDLKLFEMAKSGDIKALDQLDRRKHNRKGTRYNY